MEIEFGVHGWSLEDSGDPLGVKFENFLDDDPLISGSKLQELQGGDPLADLQSSIDYGYLSDGCNWLDTKVDLIDILGDLPVEGQLDIWNDLDLLTPEIPATLPANIIKPEQNQSYQPVEDVISQSYQLQSQMHIDCSTVTLSPDTYQFEPTSPGTDGNSSGSATPVEDQHTDIQETELYKMLTASQEYPDAVLLTGEEMFSLHYSDDMHQTIAMEDLQSDQTHCVDTNSLFIVYPANEVKLVENSSTASHDDLESMLSYNTNSGSDSDEDYVPKMSSGRRCTKTKPYRRSSSSAVSDRKERKKQQNKDAATRYRLKKRAEAGVVFDELRILQDRNAELRGNVDQMTQEIRYLKSLMAEVNEKRKNFEK